MVNAAAGAEGDPLVEDGVVVAPGAIGPFDPFDHGFVGVVGLGAPGLVDNGGGEDFLPGAGEHFHVRLKDGKVLWRPGLYAVVTGDGEGVLPEVEMEVPFVWWGEGGVLDVEVDFKGKAFAAAGGDGDGDGVGAGFGVARHVEADPNGPCGACGEVEGFGGVEDLASKRPTLPFCVTDEVRLDVFRECATAFRLNTELADIGGGPEGDLDVDALAAPCSDRGGEIGLAERRGEDVVFREPEVYGDERALETEVVVRGRDGRFVGRFVEGVRLNGVCQCCE